MVTSKMGQGGLKEAMKKWLPTLLVSCLTLSVASSAHAQDAQETTGALKVYTAELASGQAVAMMGDPHKVKVYVGLFRDAIDRDAYAHDLNRTDPAPPNTIDLTPKEAKALADFIDPTRPDEGSVSQRWDGLITWLICVKLQGSKDMALIMEWHSDVVVVILTEEERGYFARGLRWCVDDILDALS